MVKCVLKYLQGTIKFGLHFSSSSILNLYIFSNADCTNCPLTRCSTIGYCVFHISSCISWFSKKQHVVSQSSSKAEYKAMAQNTRELTQILVVLHDLGFHLPSSQLLLCDNLRALYMTVNSILHVQSKHIKIHYYYVCECEALWTSSYLACLGISSTC